MSFMLHDAGRFAATVTIHQSAWPAIWLWLCKHVPVDPGRSRAGCFNNGAAFTEEEARKLADVLEQNGAEPDAPWELTEDRRRRLTTFFRECGGFTID